MLMLKQILTEVKFEKRKLNLLCIGLCIGILFIKSWTAVALAAFCYIFYAVWKKKGFETQEVVCFLPEGQKAFSIHCLLKACLESGVYSVLFLLGQIYCFEGRIQELPYRGDVMCGVMLSLMTWIICSFGIVENENAGRHHLEKKTYLVLCCPLWYRVLRMLQLAAFAYVIVSSLEWIYVDGETVIRHKEYYSDLGTWIMMACSVIFSFVSMIFMMRHLCRNGYLGDYNGKAVEL